MVSSSSTNFSISIPYGVCGHSEFFLVGCFRWLRHLVKPWSGRYHYTWPRFMWCNIPPGFNSDKAHLHVRTVQIVQHDCVSFQLRRHIQPNVGGWMFCVVCEVYSLLQKCLICGQCGFLLQCYLSCSAPHLQHIFSEFISRFRDQCAVWFRFYYYMATVNTDCMLGWAKSNISNDCTNSSLNTFDKSCFKTSWYVFLV